MNCQLFKDAGLQADFERDGYAVIDLAAGDEVTTLLQFYASLQNAPMPGHGFQVSLDNEEEGFVRRVADELLRVIGPAIDREFKDHQMFTASFVVKETNPAGIVPPHQDWTFVDETRYWSATVWCPLQDVGIENGALGVIRGSHRFYDHVRPSPSPQYEPPFKDQLSVLFPYIRLLDLKAGQAVVFNNRTIHASPPNLSGRTRIGFGIGITHRDAALRHYYKLPGRDPASIEGYAIDREFYFRYNNARLSVLHQKGEKPQGLTSLGIFPIADKTYPTPELVRLLDQAGNQPDDRLRQYMESLPAFASAPADTSSGRTTQSRQPGTPVASTPRLPFWKVYTPLNIYREIKYRLTKKSP